MPEVKIKYRFPLTPSIVRDLAIETQLMVAKALDCSNPDGRLVPDDIEVEVRKMAIEGVDKFNFDITNCDLHIVVEANDYPERRRDLKTRRERLKADVQKFFQEHLYPLKIGLMT